ncbi:MAG TPA: CRISPR-associated endonuclease Cas2 [Planctomycetota bacterium]|nr:CRISPR-associated endonuclease Cas2 [Planctomycetota bacterium]
MSRPLSEFRGMWLFTLFDLPVDPKARRRDAANFRKELLKRGFQMLQYSVYAQYFPSEESCSACRSQVKCIVPKDGQVRIMAVTDHQFGKMDVFQGKTILKAEPPPEQLLLF